MPRFENGTRVRWVYEHDVTGTVVGHYLRTTIVLLDNHSSYVFIKDERRGEFGIVGFYDYALERIPDVTTGRELAKRDPKGIRAFQGRRVLIDDGESGKEHIIAQVDTNIHRYVCLRDGNRWETVGVQDSDKEVTLLPE